MRTKLKTFFVVLIGLLISIELHADNWRSYLSYYQVIAITQGDQQIFAANDNGLFSYHISDKTFETRSRVEGLSDSGISAISWSASRGALLVGYANGNLDLLSGRTILNLPDIKLKVSIAKRKINNILCDGDFAWLCCDFGIVKINLKKWEVSETWVIGPNASAIKINELAMDERYFWAATESGLFRAEKNNSNLPDSKNWILQNQIPDPEHPFNSVAVYNNKVYTCDRSDRIYCYDGNIWQSVYPGITGIRRIRASPLALLLVCEKGVEVISPSNRTSILNYGILFPENLKIAPSDVLQTGNGELWIGDRNLGLFQKTAGYTFFKMVPTSPAENNISWLTSLGNNLYGATGTDHPESAGIPAEIYRLKDQNWISINEVSDIKLSGIKNVSRIASSTLNPDHFWGSTSANGLLEFVGQRMIKQYNSANSPLETTNGICKIGGLSYDSSGILWITNPLGKNQLHLIKPDGTWKSMGYPGIDNPFSSAGDLIISKNDTKWIIVNHSDLFALRTGKTLDQTSDDQYRKTSVRSRFSNGETTILKGFNQINTILEDRDGYLWIGTENGVVLYTNPEGLFSDAEFYGIQPSVDLGDGLFHPLLENDTVNAIVADGGNRKWFGTSNSGVFLFSADGSKLLRQFNADNSPLFSNKVTSISISGESGEVFFATDKGLISWMGDATQGKESYERLYVWPNPVRETWNGDVTIDGLSEDSEVKITDIAGNLIFKTTSNGGRAIWDGKNRNGSRVNTGVYLIFCSDSEGNRSKVIKLLFIH